MSPDQQHLAVIIPCGVILFALLMTALVTTLYKKIVYVPVQALLSEVERASSFEDRTEHPGFTLRTGNQNRNTKLNPCQIWTDRVHEYIDNVTKERFFDEMTGCLNHKYFSQAISEILKTQMLCSLTPNKDYMYSDINYYGMYLIDIDHFKLINDEFGHLYGDQVLTQVGRTLRSTVGSDGVVVRNGGEEFLIIMSLGYPLDFAGVAEKIRTEFSDTVYVTNIKTQEIRSLTCSIGYLPFPFYKANKTALSVQQHVNLADQAMYLAKSGGRNTWRGLEVIKTPGDQLEFEKAAVSVEYGIEAGYYKIRMPK